MSNPREFSHTFTAKFMGLSTEATVCAVPEQPGRIAISIAFMGQSFKLSCSVQDGQHVSGVFSRALNASVTDKAL